MARNQVMILGGVTLVAGAAVAVWLALAARDAPAPQAAIPASAAPAPTQAPAPPPVAANQPEAPQTVPAFDVVRVSAEGEALVAGNAPPGAAIMLRVDGAAVAQAAADAGGQFVTLFSLGYSEAAQVMTLEMVDAQGRVVEATDTVLLTPRPAPPVAESGTEAPLAEASPDAAPQAEAPLAEGENNPAPEALAEGASDTAPQVAEVSEEPAPNGVAPLAAGEADPAPQVAEVSAEPAPQGGALVVAGGADEGAQVAMALAEPAPQSGAPGATADAETAPEIATPVAESAVQIAAVSDSVADPAPGPAEATVTAAESAEVARAETPEPPLSAAEAAPAATAILMRGDGRVQVLDRAPQVMDNVVIDAITYSDAGDVQISGRAAGRDPSGNLRVYLDNQPVALARAEGGDWTLDLPAIDAGIYTLRVDQLGAEGGVVSRFETPFLRESPEALAGARARSDQAAEAVQTASLQTPAPEGAPAAPASTAPSRPRAELITVQPGNTLWAISRDRYGEGARYMVIFNANRSQIRDPDLIYPGQVFSLPDE